MKNTHSFFLTALLMMACIVVTAYGEDPNWPTNNSRPIPCNFGFKNVATLTITVDDVTSVDLNDYLPTGTLGFEIRAASGSFIIGNENDIASGTAVERVGRLVAEGESYIWNNNAGTFNGSVLGVATDTIIKIDGAWGFWSDSD